ncbi:hypothetical protein Acsp04_66630 [Actinomadura sp. NBRC 104425]|nr:hypothetical protein Acsp04_66630 [Actinomadura sp. NBRC 104425]
MVQLPEHWSCNSICFAGLGAFDLPIALHCMNVGFGVATTEANCGRAERKASADARAKVVASESLNCDAMVLCGGGYCAQSFRPGRHSRAADDERRTALSGSGLSSALPKNIEKTGGSGDIPFAIPRRPPPVNVDNNSRTPWPKYSPPPGPECRDAS